jgi:glycosyltransferase involved in cell wall biosynthesis
MASRIHVWAPGFRYFGGGIGAFSRELALALESLGHDVALFGKCDSPGKWDGRTLWGVGAGNTTLSSARFAAGVLAACVRDRPQHVITTHVNYAPVAHFAKAVTGVPFSVVAHGIDVQHHLDDRKTAAMKAAARVFAVSEFTTQLVVGAGVNPGRVRLLPNTVDETRFTLSGQSTELRQRYALSPGERVVLTVGRLDSTEAYKGYDRIIEALPAIINVCGPTRFILAGSGDDGPRLLRLAKKTGVEQRVTLAGFVPDAELADHYRLADVFAMPSTGEGFGIVFLEAMACGTPVLGGNRDGSVDALDGGKLGKLVDPLNVQEIAAGIIDLLMRKGPSLWYDKAALREAVVHRFGREAFRATLQQSLDLSPVNQRVIG